MSVQAAGRAALIRGVRGSKKARRMGYQGTPGGQVLRKVAGVRPAHLLYRKSGRKSRLLIGHSATEAAECARPCVQLRAMCWGAAAEVLRDAVTMRGRCGNGS